MPVIYQGSNPDLYEYVEDRNLQGQWFLLETLTEYALKASSYRFSLDTLYALHHSAAVYLDESPGSIRKGFNHIKNSAHVPPAPEEVLGHLYDFFRNSQRQVRARITYASGSIFSLAYHLDSPFQ